VKGAGHLITYKIYNNSLQSSAQLFWHINLKNKGSTTQRPLTGSLIYASDLGRLGENKVEAI